MKKAAIITGGSGSLGHNIAHFLAEKKYDLMIHYNESEESAKTLAQTLMKDYKIMCRTMKEDFKEVASYERLMSTSLKKLPHTTLLINNASIFSREAFLDTEFKKFSDSIFINLIAPIFLTQNFSKQVKKGCVINILDGYISNKYSPYFVYMLCKKSLSIFTEMAAQETGEMRINAVCPYIVTSKNKKEELMKKHTDIAKFLSIILQIINDQSQSGKTIFI